jgi:hypothetical protein
LELLVRSSVVGCDLIDGEIGDEEEGSAWRPFLTYRTMCLAPQPDFRRVLAGVLAMELAA